VGGFGPGIPSLPDGSELFNACFSYIGGTSTLKWYDANGTACEYTDATSLDPLYDLPQSTYYIDGVVTAPLIADFSADHLTPPRNSTVTFTDLSTGGPTSWDWSFDRTTFIYMPGFNSHSQNPQVQFTQGGPYTVTLTVHNAYLTDTKVKVAYIWVGIPGLWTGETSTDWYTTTNWDDWRVPTSSTDVIIPAAALHWPYYIGTFTIGVQCNNITLSAITSQMTVTGDFIQP
jgi:PKD repeat protein